MITVIKKNIGRERLQPQLLMGTEDLQLLAGGAGENLGSVLLCFWLEEELAPRGSCADNSFEVF